MLKLMENHMIELQDILGGVHYAELRDRRVFIDGAEVADLEPTPVEGEIRIILGNGWPLHVPLAQLQPLAPIAEYLPRTYLCIGCQSPVVYLQLPPPDEKWCPQCSAIQAQEGAAWEAQRAHERQQYAGMNRAQVEALYQQAKAQVRQLPYDSEEWRYWRRVQLDASGHLTRRCACSSS
jgi:hypothetical protein